MKKSVKLTVSPFYETNLDPTNSPSLMTDRPTDWLDLTSYLIMCTLKPILCNFGHFYLKFAGWLKGRLELLRKFKYAKK